MATKEEPLFYVKQNAIFHRPVKKPNGNLSMGFCVCEVCDGVEPQEVCDLLNEGSKHAD